MKVLNIILKYIYTRVQRRLHVILFTTRSPPDLPQEPQDLNVNNTDEQILNFLNEHELSKLFLEVFFTLNTMPFTVFRYHV